MVKHAAAVSSTSAQPTADGCESQIIAQMMAAGIEVPPATIIQDGKVHRFASTPERSAAGWYVVHPDPVAPVWWFGDWRTGIKERGEADPGRILNPAETAARSKRLDALRAKIEHDREMFQAGAAIDARQRWERCKPAPGDHPYLMQKRIEPCGTRIDGHDLLIPMRDANGKLWSLQEIAPDGRKNNQGGRPPQSLLLPDRGDRRRVLPLRGVLYRRDAPQSDRLGGRVRRRR
jgi:putative DNA primase/helicase